MAIVFFLYRIPIDDTIASPIKPNHGKKTTSHYCFKIDYVKNINIDIN